MGNYIYNIFQEKSYYFSAQKNEDASSELIGSIILIGLFVAAFGIVLVMLLSSSTEFVVPAVVIEPQPITEWNGTYVLDMQAGDTLLRDETRIIVDGSDKTAEFMEDPSPGPGDMGWQEWGAGDSLYLEYSSSEQPNAVQVIYYSPEGDGILLWELGSTENRLPVAAFIANVTQGYSPLTVSFTDKSVNGPVTWLWSFGDGETSSLQNPMHTYTSPGDYTVRLTVTNQYDQDTLVKSGYIYVSNVFAVDFVGTPLSGTAPLMVTFTDQTTGGPSSWQWNFGDGGTSTQQNPVHTYTAGGSYTVTLQATVDNVTQSETKVAYINVTANCIPGLYGTYVDEFNDEYWVPFSGNPTYRVDEILWFADDSSGWDSIEDNWPDATLGKTNQFGVTYDGYLIVPANDTYTLYLTSDDGSVLWLDDVLDTDAVLIDNWGGDGLHGPVEVSASVYLTKGRYPIRVKMTENWGGALLHLEWESAGIPREPIDSFCHIPGGLTAVDFVATPLSGVAPLGVQFTDLSVGNITSWVWDFGDGATSTEENPLHTYTSSGEYTVILVVSDGNVSYTEEKTEYIYVTEGCLPGLLGTYYDEYNSQYQIPFSGTPEQRVDLRLWFADTESGEESDEVNWPVSTLGKADGFSVEYMGNLIVPKDETYTFYLRSDDGSVLWIDNVADIDPVFIDNWGLHSPLTRTASLPLTKGKHPIRIKMTENNGDAVLHLEWESATIPLQPVESFCHGTGTLLKAEFDATPLNGTRPLNVQFTDHSTGTITSWLWDFGDGSSSTMQNPTHVYTDSGQYTVSLNVTDDTSSDTETKDQYINVSGMPSPAAWWRFDEASGSTAVDSSDNGNDGTIEGSAVDRRAGACGTGLYFDGNSSWVTVPDDETLSFNDTFTFAGWFRPEVPEYVSGQGQYRNLTQIIGKGYDYYNLNQHSNNYELFLKTQNDLLSFEENGAGDALSDEAFTSDTTGLPVSYNDWFHLTVVVDGGIGSVYVDGILEDTFPVDRIPFKENNEPVSIGKQIVTGIDWAEFYYKGMMDELYLFGTALTSEEILSLADACTPEPEQPPGVSFTGVPLTGDAPLNVQFNSTISGYGPFTYLWDFSDGSTSDEANPMHLYSSPGLYTVSLTVTNSGGSSSEVKEQYIDVTGMPLPVAWWRFDEASGSTAVDSSGNGNDGTIQGGVADRREGACGTGLYFDGTTSWVNVPNDATLSFNDTFTFAGWFRPEVPEYVSGQGNDYKYFTQIIGKGYDRYGLHQFSNNFEIYLRIPNDLLQFEANGDADSSSDQAFTSDASGLPVSYNDWFHLTVVVDGGEGLVYVDGNLVSSFSVDRTPLKENSEPVSIGKQIVSIDWAEFYYKGMMDELYLYGVALTADEVNTLADACTPSAGEAPGVSFSAAPVTGNAPLEVQFTSTVTGTAPITYAWNFGDGTTSTEQNPVHTYADAGTYSVNLTVSNPYGTDTLERADYIEVISAFAEYIVNENVFVYGSELSISGDSVSGPGATIHITGDTLNTNDLNGGASVAVSNIYVDGSIDLDGGSAGLGSETSPGSIYVNGDLTLGSGTRHVYGDVYVNGNCLLKGPVMHGNVYIDGDLELDWGTPNLDDANVYYTGSFTYPASMSNSILNKCVQNATVPGFVTPDYTMPPVKSDEFYSSQGYVSGGTLVSNIKIFADSYTSNNWVASAYNVIIVAKTGDIVLTNLGGSGVTGVLFAPNGKVEFNGGSFEGLVIAKDGFRVTSGGTAVTFKNMDQYISDPADYPF